MSSLKRTIQRSIKRQGFSDKQIRWMRLFANVWQQTKAHKRERMMNGIHVTFTPSFVKYCNYQVNKMLSGSARPKK